MKKRILSALLVLSLVLAISTKAQATNVIPVQGNPFEEPIQIRCTCYVDTGTTASGQQTRYGIISGKKEWQGCAAVLYDEDMQMIGIFEVLDTGRGIDLGDGTYSIPEGQSIDVWVEDLISAKEWTACYGDYVYMYLVKGVG